MTGAILAGLAAGALWGLVFIAPKFLPGFSPLEVTLGRYAAYAGFCLVMAATARGRMRSVLRPGPILTALGLAVLSNSLYYGLLVVGVRDAGVAVAGLVIGTIPLWLSMLGRLEAHAVQPPWSRLALPMLLVAAGIVLVNAQAFRDAQAAGSQHFARGLAAALAALACWTAYPYLNARYLKRHPEIDNLAWTNLIGLATAAGLVLALPAVGGSSAGFVPGRGWAAFLTWSLVMGIGSSWVATWLWNHASTRLPVSLAGQLIVSETLFALFYGFLYDGRWPHLLEWGAMAAFVAGILLAIRAFR